MVARRLTAPVLLPCDPECSVVRDAVVDIETHSIFVGEARDRRLERRAGEMRVVREDECRSAVGSCFAGVLCAHERCGEEVE